MHRGARAHSGALGGHAAVAALGNGERALAAGEAIPSEPYANLRAEKRQRRQGGRTRWGEHTWLHRAHEASKEPGERPTRQ